MGFETFFKRTACAVLVASVLGGCSPALNWRNVPVDSGQLTVSLPCKPDHATRPVKLGSKSVDIAMVGCEAQGGLYALSTLTLDDPSQIGATLLLWRAAVRAQLGGKAGQGAAISPSDASMPPETPFTRKGSLNVPQSVRAQLSGRRPDGSAVQADGVWFARLVGTKAQIVHAVVYADRLDKAAADNFFNSIALQ